MNKLIIKIIKVFLLFLVAAALISGVYLGYLEYEKIQKSKAKLITQKLKVELISKKLKAELSYQSEYEWSWHNEYKRIQIRHFDDLSKNILRKVYKHKDHVVYAYKNDDYSLSATVLFFVPCEPESEIITSKEFSSGGLKKLVCNSDGEALRFSVTWPDKRNDRLWIEKLDGFNVSVDFSDWDFTKLDQEITLSKAKSKDDINEQVDKD